MPVVMIGWVGAHVLIARGTHGCPHLHRDWAHPCHTCAGTGLAPLTSAPRLDSPLPHGLGSPLVLRLRGSADASARYAQRRPHRSQLPLQDNCNRLWDMRTARQFKRFKGHQNTSKNFVRARFMGPSNGPLPARFNPPPPRVREASSQRL
jgi:hypothetical protein